MAIKNAEESTGGVSTKAVDYNVGYMKDRD
jgi:hypothetical protein